MFFDIGWPELMLIGVVALVVIGPKDLPAALRVAGFWVRKARIMSREFQTSVEQMIRDAELDEIHKELKQATEIDLNRELEKAIDPKGELAASIQPPNVPDYLEAPPTPGALPPPAEIVPEARPAEPTIMPPAAEIAAAEAEAAIEALPPQPPPAATPPAEPSAAEPLPADGTAPREPARSKP